MQTPEVREKEEMKRTKKKKRKKKVHSDIEGGDGKGTMEVDGSIV